MVAANWEERFYKEIPRNPTPTELEVLRAYAITYSNKATAHYLGMSQSTVKNHLSELYSRLSVGTVVEAMTALGWVKVPDVPPKQCNGVKVIRLRCKGDLAHDGGHIYDDDL